MLPGEDSNPCPLGWALDLADGGKARLVQGHCCLLVALPFRCTHTRCGHLQGYLLFTEGLLPQMPLLLVEYLSDGDAERKTGVGFWSQEIISSQILKTSSPSGLLGCSLCYVPRLLEAWGMLLLKDHRIQNHPRLLAAVVSYVGICWYSHLCGGVQQFFVLLLNPPAGGIHWPKTNALFWTLMGVKSGGCVILQSCESWPEPGVRGLLGTLWPHLPSCTGDCLSQALGTLWAWCCC